MKKPDFRKRVQWGYFKSAIIGLAIGMLIAPGISDILREYEASGTGERVNILDRAQDEISELKDRFMPGEKVKVLVNGEVAAVARSAEEGEAAFKAARLAYNAEGIKPLYVDMEYILVDNESEADKALVKELKIKRDEELTDAILSCFDRYADKDKKTAYTMRIDDYTVTVEHFEDIVSVLEEAQSAYDPDNEFQVGLKKPSGNNVTMYEVEVVKKSDDDADDAADNSADAGDSSSDSEVSSDAGDNSSDGESSDSNRGISENSILGKERIIRPAQSIALTAGESDGGGTDSTGSDNSEDTAADVDETEASKEDSAVEDETEASEEDSALEDGTEASEETLEAEESKDPAVEEAEAKLGAEDGVKYVGFSDKIQVMETYVSSSEIKSRDAVLSEITSPKEESGIYVVEPGDYLGLISEKVNMSEEQIKELNPQIESDDDIYYDDRLNILVPTAPVEVLVEKQETYTENYYANIEYQDDESMYIGDTAVVQEGSPGTHTVTDMVTYKGNLESGRERLDEIVEVAAVAEVVLRGTKSKPTYMYPVTNWNITSNFGYRWGRLHAGTDVGVPIGTTVRASRGGQVITAGWVGGYGNCVIIDHGDGVSTRYGHLSEVLVSVGQYVDQGDQIALSGNTGRSTGPHLHFEIRINGEAVDPLPYLYQTAE